MQKDSALRQAEENVLKNNPNLPMKLRFEVSEKKTIDKLLSVDDLTLNNDAKDKNIIGLIFEKLVENLEKMGNGKVSVVRENPVVSVEDNFDNLLFPSGNPGRSSTYTRYVDENHVLRTHTSAAIPGTFRVLDRHEIDKNIFVVPGLCYRRDVIDTSHLDVFHQIDVWTLQSRSRYGDVGRKELLDLAKVVFESACPDAEMIVYEAEHPYTCNGIEVYAEVEGEKIEVLEAGTIHPKVLELAGLDPNEFTGLALGMGMERLIMARKKLPDIRLIRSTDERVSRQMLNMENYIDVSNQPKMTRDMSYCINSNESEEDICESIKEAFSPNDYLIEEVRICERTNYKDLHPKAIKNLGAKVDQDNVLVQIILRHPDKTLTKDEAARMYEDAYPKLHKGDSSGYAI